MLMNIRIEERIMPQRFNAALTNGNWPNNPEKLVRDDKGDYVLYSEYGKLLKAVEFAEYLAKAAERFMDAINAYDAISIKEDEGGNLEDGEMEDAMKCRGESFKNLGSAIYEFRKRNERIQK